MSKKSKYKKRNSAFWNAFRKNQEKEKQQQTYTTTTELISPYPVEECYQKIIDDCKEPEIIELTITEAAWLKLMFFINLIGDYEISGFGKVVNDKIVDFDILGQTVRGAYVESNEDEVSEFIRKLPAEERKYWILDWHSHVNMGTNPSGTDWNNYKEMLSLRLGKQFPIMIVNKRKEVTAYQIISEHNYTKIEIKREHIDIEKLKKQGILMQLYQECKAKIIEKCKQYKTVTTYAPSFGLGANATTNKPKTYWNYYDDDDWDDDEEVWNAQQQGYIFNDPKEQLRCQECDALLWTQQEIERKVCNKCFNEALKGI